MPLALLYGAAEALRRRLTKPEKPEIPVICVGNLTAGGAGKTPTVRALADILKGAGHQPIVLSRGYGGRNTGPLRVDPTLHVAADTGDEPLMLSDDLTVYIARDRRAALRAAVSDGAQIAIKDDGFQNPTLAHNYNLIVVDAATGFGNALLLPAGPLRQPLAASAPRIDAVLLVGETSEQIRPTLPRNWAWKPSAFSTAHWCLLRPTRNACWPIAALADRKNFSTRSGPAISNWRVKFLLPITTCSAKRCRAAAARGRNPQRHFDNNRKRPCALARGRGGLAIGRTCRGFGMPAR